MRVSMLVRTTALLGALVSLAACSDSPVAPPAATRSDMRPLAFTAPPTLKKDGANVEVKVLEDGKLEFTIDPSRAQNVLLGEHTLSFPAYSICDPETSSYGPQYWDAPCRPLRHPITFKAKWSVEDGHAQAEFEPSVRFVPASARDYDNWVILSFREPKSLRADRDYQILWKSSGGGKWIDESKYDPTLRAWTDRGGNRVSRRIKHFSGYNVTAGFMDISVEVGVDVPLGRGW